MTHQNTVSQALADYFAALEYGDIDRDNVDAVKALLLDCLGVALGGSVTESGTLAATLAMEEGGRAEATLIGRSRSVPAAQAAFANAVAAHSLELDDVDREALFHFGPPVVSAALATAEAVGASGQQLVTAIICGCELMERISWAANPALRDRGFHTTAVAGVFGAAVASAKLLGLRARELVSALGLAGAQASGLMEMYGSSMQKRFNPGPAARNGVTAARLAKLGFTGAETIFEGERGFLRAFAGGGCVECLMPDPGRPYRLMVEFKPYACARPIHSAIDAVRALRPQAYPRLGSITEIRVYRHPMWAQYHTSSRPRTYHEAQVSLPYSVAVALVCGDAFVDQYVKVETMSPEIRDLMGKIRILPEPGLPGPLACRVEIVLSDDDSMACQVDHPRGSIMNPMSEEERHAKFARLARRVLPAEKVQTLAQVVSEVENLQDVRALGELLRPPAEGAGSGT